MKVINPEFAMAMLLFDANQDEEKTIKVKDAIKTVEGIAPLDIVNCNECKYCITHYRGSLGYYCAYDYNEFKVEPNDFCSRGEQKC